MNKEIEILAFLNAKHVGKDKAIHSKKLEGIAESYLK